MKPALHITASGTTLPLNGLPANSVVDAHVAVVGIGGVGSWAAEGLARSGVGRLTLIDEALTPDSSRFWPMDTYAPGTSPPSFDKQFVRDYLETLDWNKTAPGPKLPAHVIQHTSEKYEEALRRLTA